MDSILERAAALVRWNKEPAGYMAGEDAPQKIAEAFALLEQLTADPTLAMKAENCQLHIHVRHLEARIARLTDPDAQLGQVRNARHAATGIIARLEERIKALETAKEAVTDPACTVALVGIQNAAGALVSGLHVLAGDAWKEVLERGGATLETDWKAGHRDVLYDCRPRIATHTTQKHQAINEPPAGEE